jgi:MFS family permease
MSHDPEPFTRPIMAAGSWPPKREPDVSDVNKAPHRRGWIAVAIVFVNLAMVYGIWYSYSVFLVAFLREFGWSRSTVAGAFSLFVIVHGLLAPLNGWLMGRVGARRIILVGGCVLGAGLVLMAESRAWWHLYLTFGGLAGIGVACAGWLPSVLVVRGWFPDRVGTALGVASAGIGIGIAGLVPVAQMLVDSFGWRWACRILGVVVAGWVVPATALILRNPPTGAPARKPERAVGGDLYWTLASAVRDWHFWGLAVVFASGNVVTQMLLVHQVAFLVDHGVTPIAAASIGGLVGLLSIPGKIGWGILSDRTNREVAYSLAFVCVVLSIGALVQSGRQPASVLPYVYAALIGLGYAATAPLTPAAANDIFGGPRFSVIFGTLHVSNSIGGSLGSWIGGRIFDWTGSYNLALALALGMAVLSASLLWVVAPRRPVAPPERHERQT